MKSEKIILDEKGMIIQKTHDATPVLNRVQAAREIGKPIMSESRYVGSLPAAMVYEKAREKGVRLDDHEAMQDVLMSLLANRDYSKFRAN